LTKSKDSNDIPWGKVGLGLGTLGTILSGRKVRVWWRKRRQRKENEKISRDEQLKVETLKRLIKHDINSDPLVKALKDKKINIKETDQPLKDRVTADLKLVYNDREPNADESALFMAIKERLTQLQKTAGGATDQQKSIISTTLSTDQQIAKLYAEYISPQRVQSDLEQAIQLITDRSKQSSTDLRVQTQKTQAIDKVLAEVGIKIEPKPPTNP
jgi:hypothetical protein